METTTVLDIDPKDIGRHIFQKGWYEGELTRVVILTRTEDSDYAHAGDKTLQIQGTLETDEGKRPMDERFDLQGTRAWKAAKMLKDLNATKGMDMSAFRGAKVRVEFDDPYVGEKSTRNTILNISLVG